MSDTHPSSETIAAYLDGTLADDARTQVDLHVRGCIACRAELQELTELLASAPGAPVSPVAPIRMRARRFVGPALVGVAAALLLFFIVPRRANTPVVRGTGDAPKSEGTTPIAVVTPPRGATVTGAVLTLAWRPAAAGANYHVALVDSIGRALWSARTGDTTAVVPADVVARASGRTFWYVDALGTDGRMMTSGMSELRLAR